MPSLEWKIDMGHVLTIAITIVTLAATWGSVSNKIDSHTQILQDLKVSEAAFSESLTRVREEQSRVAAVLAEHDKADAEWRVTHVAPGR